MRKHAERPCGRAARLTAAPDRRLPRPVGRFGRVWQRDYNPPIRHPFALSLDLCRNSGNSDEVGRKDRRDFSATITAVRHILQHDGLFVFRIKHLYFCAPINVADPHQEFDEDGNLTALQVTNNSKDRISDR